MDTDTVIFAGNVSNVVLIIKVVLESVEKLWKKRKFWLQFLFFHKTYALNIF